MNIGVGLAVALAAASPPKLIGDPATWISPDDYPREAMRDSIEGTTGVEMSVGVEGTVSACRIVKPSGSAILDEATCRILSERARFEPARDRKGRAQPSLVARRVRWMLPDGAMAARLPKADPLNEKVAFTVTEEGRIEDCRVLANDGVPATVNECALMTAGLRFAPPLDRNGEMVRRRVTYQRIMTVEDVATAPAAAAPAAASPKQRP